jgi:hypothetical protein
MTWASILLGVSMGLAALFLLIAGAPGHALAMLCLGLAAMFFE